MSKAFNNSVPEQLREPFYRDHEDQEHLKPQLVHLLANAELYCLALGNIYSDPNYHNMNHTGVLQVLLRKGVFVSDTAPTETVLIQTNPLKMSAHLSVMEAVMTLYAKEVATPDRVLAAVQRFSLSSAPPPPANTAPADHEQALLLWVRNAVAALRERILEETGSENEGEFPKIGDLGDLGDGALLAGLVAFYCPEELAWQSITLSKVPSMTDRLRNLMLVHEFCQHSLPYSVFHMTPEDVCYMRESMKQNLLVFLADLFNVLEIHPAKCVRFDRNSASLTQAYPRNSQGVAHKRCLPQSVSAIPDLRSNLDAHSPFSGSPLSSSGGLKKSHSIHQTEAPPMDNREETFVVHRGKGIPTLSSMQQQQQDGGGMTRAMKEAAGKPSNWEDSRRSSYAGRRSRRNSLSEDSQLTLENFGGSQENLHFLGRNPDKEPAVHVGRRDSSASRSSLNDNKSTNLHNALQQEHNGDAVHAELRKASAKATANSDELASILGGDSSPGPAKKTTTFATLPAQSTTTWQQQQQQQQHKPPPPPASSTTDSQSETESADGQGGLMGSTLLNIRLKLEEKRRRIESDKRRMEAVMNRQRQKVGKAAFLQAVTKERALTQVLDALTQQSHNIPNNNNNEIVSPTRLKEPMSPPTPRSAAQPMRVPPTTSQLQNDVDDNEDGSQGVGLIIGSELLNPDPSQLDEMERKKERILLLSLQRRQAQEEAKARKEAEAARRKENEKRKEEERLRKKEEEKARRAAILDQYKLKKAIEEAEREGKNVDKEFLNSLKIGSSAANMSVGGGGGGGGPPKMRSRTQPARPRPKTIHIDSGSAPHDTHDGTLTPSRGKKGSSSNLSVYNSSPMRRDYYRGSQDSLAETRRTTGSYNHHTGNFGEDSRGASPGRTLGRRGSYKTSRDPSPDRPYATQYGRSRSNAKYGTYQGRRKSNSLMNLSGSSCDQDSLLYRYGDTDSGLGRATPPRRAPSPGQHPPSPSGPGSLPAHRRRYDDTASESGSDYSGPRLYKQPATKSNKGIILNAVEYCVFPGVVNREAKRRVLEEINRSEAKHFLVLFRDAGCQFRALYSYCPDTEEVAKLYGTGPKLVSDRMFDKFFKYNSGGKCFSQVHTKHLTVTIDAFTIHNSLWQGKKVNLPSKRDMVLVI